MARPRWRHHKRGRQAMHGRREQFRRVRIGASGGREGARRVVDHEHAREACRRRARACATRAAHRSAPTRASMPAACASAHTANRRLVLPERGGPVTTSGPLAGSHSSAARARTAGRSLMPSSHPVPGAILGGRGSSHSGAARPECRSRAASSSPRPRGAASPAGQMRGAGSASATAACTSSSDPAAHEHGAAGKVWRNLRRIGAPDEVSRFALRCGAQREGRGDVCADLCANCASRALRCEHEVNAERPALRGKPGELRKEVPVGGGDFLKLVNDHNEPGRTLRLSSRRTTLLPPRRPRACDPRALPRAQAGSAAQGAAQDR